MMSKDIREKVIKSNGELFFASIFFVVAISILGFLKGTVSLVNFDLRLLVLALLYISFFWFLKNNTYIAILNGREMVNSGQREFFKDRFDIYNVKHIERVSAFSWRHWGSNMMIYLDNGDGVLRHSFIREANYSEESLKAILRIFLEVNPSIDLNEQYKELLSGKYDNSVHEFKKVNATYKIADVEKAIGIR